MTDRSRSRRRHPAAATRIVAAGTAATATFGLIAVLGRDGSGPAAATPTAATPTTVVAAPTLRGTGSAPVQTAASATTTTPRPAVTVPPAPAVPVRRVRPVTRSAAS